jgi:GAF domain-containing protein
MTTTLLGTGNQDVGLPPLEWNKGIERFSRTRVAVMLHSSDQDEQSVRSLEQATVEHQLSLLAKLGRRALIDISPQQLMDETVALVTRGLAADYGSVFELLPDGQGQFQAGVGWKEGLVGRPTIELQARFAAGQVIITKRPMVIEDLKNDQRFQEPSLLHDHGVMSSVSVPIHGRSRPLGVLGVHTVKPRTFTASDIDFVQVVANILARALERRWQQEHERERYEQRVEQMMALGQVAAGVAHELRNPLTAIKGLVQVNLRKAAANSLPTADLAVIEHEIRRMERSLQVFLDFARPTQPDRHRLDLAQIVERVITLVAGRANKQNVAVRFLQPDTPVWMEADPDQIQQLLLNLVLNSLDAMPNGGSIDIDLRASRNGWCELYVRDTGSGIAPHILPKVFETFVSSKETGLGLGLPVSRRIAEDHGGTLRRITFRAAGPVSCSVRRRLLPSESPCGFFN